MSVYPPFSLTNSFHENKKETQAGGVEALRLDDDSTFAPPQHVTESRSAHTGVTARNMLRGVIVVVPM